MHYYEYHHKSSETEQKAMEKFPWLFEWDYSLESIEVRYHLLEYLHREYWYGWILEKDENGKPIPIIIQWTLLYWSISHSNNYVSFIISDEPTGIDIVEYEERDISLLDMHSDSEYDLLGAKSWINFYILWTAKESIIKCIGWQLDDMKNIVCIPKQSDMISLFAFREKTYRIQTLKTGSVIISYII